MSQPNPLDRPPIHALVYGESGSRKTSFARTFPKPMLVLGFDPMDKMTPYRKLGKVTEYHDAGFYDGLGIRVLDIRDKANNLLVQLEHYADPNPDLPVAYERFVQRAPYLADQVANGEWKTVVVDSVTFLQYAYLRFDEKVLNPTYKDPRLFYGDLKREMVNQLMTRFVYLPTNVVVIAHTDADKSEFAVGMRRGLDAVGTLGKQLPTGYGETYHAVVTEDKVNKSTVHLLQTRSDTLFFAASQIDAPNPCELEYEKLWVNFDKEEGS